MEQSDISKLKKEVLDHGPEAALPANLPDVWIKLIARDLEMHRNGAIEKNEDHSYLSAPLAIIIRILCGKNGKNEHEVRFSGKELLNFLDHLQFEIALEEIRRCSNMSLEPATLETIFTDRSVNISDKSVF